MLLTTFDSLPSTNQYCELLDLNQVEEFAVFYAREQTAGIGQRGNSWFSSPGKNLTFSLILKPALLPIADQYQLTKVVSLGLADCLSQLIPCPADIRIKWPNDIYVQRRKIAGILISHHISNSRIANSIVGIGLNVNQGTFPEYLPNPVSLFQITGNEQPLMPLLENLVGHIAHRYQQLQANLHALDEEYLSLLLNYRQPADYLYHGTLIRATILGINSFGHLMLQLSDGSAITCQLKELAFCL